MNTHTEFTGEGQAPLSIFKDEFKYLLFPTVFCGKKEDLATVIVMLMLTAVTYVNINWIQLIEV